MICICAGCFFYILEDILMVISINYRKEENWKIINDNLANLEAQNTVSICNYFLAASKPFFIIIQDQKWAKHTRKLQFSDAYHTRLMISITLNILNMRNYLYMNMIYDANLVNNVNLPTTIASQHFFATNHVNVEAIAFSISKFYSQNYYYYFYKSWKYMYSVNAF